MSFILLVVLIALTGVVIGRWMRVVVYSQVESRTPLAWVVIPSILILGATVVATGLESWRVVRGKGLTPVPPEYPGAMRFAELAAEAGVATPRLMQNTHDGTVSARSVGRPGHYVVIVSPAVLAAARRRTSTFDLILRHELAHVRAGDVALATFAVRAWYVTLTAMALPLAASLWTRDVSMVPSYLVRAGVLALVVYLVRAQLLRLREHYADLAATGTGDDQARFMAAIAGIEERPAPVTAGRRDRIRHAVERLIPPFALHPTLSQRAAIAADPALLARPRPETLLAAGFVAGSAQLLLEPILMGTGMPALNAEFLTRWLLFGLVGVIGTADVIRASSLGRPAVRRFLLPALALPLGAALGAAASLGLTGLESSILSEMTEVVIAALAVSFLLVAGVAAAHAAAPRRVVIAAFLVLGGITSASTAAFWGYIAFPFAAGMPIDVFLLFSTDALALNGAAAATGVTSLLLLPWAAWRSVATAAMVIAALGIIPPVAATVTLRSLDPLLVIALMEATGPFTCGIALVGALVLTLRHGPAAGLIAGALGAALATGVFMLLTMVWGLEALPDRILESTAWSGAITVVLGVPVVAIAGVIRRTEITSRPSWRLRWAVPVAAVAVAALALAGTGIAWMAPMARERADATRVMAENELDFYVKNVLPLSMTEWDMASTSAGMAQYLADAATHIEENVLPIFDNALENAESHNPWIADVDDPVLTNLHQSLLDALSADRAYWATVAGGDAEATNAALDEAMRAIQRLEDTYRTATEGRTAGG